MKFIYCVIGFIMYLYTIEINKHHETKNTNHNRLFNRSLFTNQNINLNIILIMDEKFEINYHGLELTVIGNFEEPDDTVGYKGGFSCESIELNDIDIKWMLKDSTIEDINDICVQLC